MTKRGTGSERKPYEPPAIEHSARFGSAELAALDGGCPADCSCDLFGRECRAPVSSSVRRGSVRYPLSRTVRLSHSELAAYLAAAETAGLELHDWMRRALAQVAAAEVRGGSEGSSGAGLKTAPRRPAARAIRRKRSSPRTW